MVFETHDGEPVIDPAVLEQINADMKITLDKTPLFFDVNKNISISLGAVIQQCLGISKNNQIGIHYGGVTFNIDPGTVHLANDPVKAFIKRIQISVQIEVKVKVLNDVGLGQYSEGNAILMEVASGKIVTSQNEEINMEVFFSRNPQTIVELNR
jgi:hypothetical protein